MIKRDFVSTLKSDSPGLGSILVSPSDTVDLVDANGAPKIARSLYVEAAGAVCFIGADDQVDTWNVPANFYINVAVSRVKATGTTATGIHAIW